MPRGRRFTTEEIIAILKEAADGATLADLSQRHGFLASSFYRWRAQYGGMEADELQRLRELQNENMRLRRLVVDGQLAIDVLLDRVTELVTQPARKPTSEHAMCDADRD